MSVLLEIKNCMDCPFHDVRMDPDPHDEFCSDDQKVICTKENRAVTFACRPHNKRSECNVPDWCPLPRDEGKKQV